MEAWEIETQGKMAPIINSVNPEVYGAIGRHSGALVLACFEKIGGLDSFSYWAKENPTEFYTKLFPKIISKTSQNRTDALGYGVNEDLTQFE